MQAALRYYSIADPRSQFLGHKYGSLIFRDILWKEKTLGSMDLSFSLEGCNYASVLEVE